jgi:glycosyltransferase involved in cell wall biosynthesis
MIACPISGGAQSDNMISVIIPTINRSAHLQNTLSSLASQQFDDEFEVLVIDNGSSDNTKDVVEEFQDRFTHLKYFFEAKPGLHEARHRGLRESNFDILAFIDDDIEAFPEWLDGIRESFRDEKVGLAGGNNLPLYEQDPPPWVQSLWTSNNDGLFMTHFSLLNFGEETKEVHPHFVFGCNFVIRKNLLIKMGGFHPDGMPPKLLKYRGDGEAYVAEQVQALGYKTLFNPRISIHHAVPASRMTIDYLKKRAYAEGITRSYIDIRYKRQTPAGLLSKLRKVLRQTITLAKPIDHAVLRSFQQGYTFHQEELKKDRELLAWVTKESYL